MIFYFIINIMDRGPFSAFNDAVQDLYESSTRVYKYAASSQHNRINGQASSPLSR